MTNKIYNNIKELIAGYYPNIQDLLKDVESAALPCDITDYAKALRLVEGGGFACTYHQVEDDMVVIYGNEYDSSRYWSQRRHDYKIKNGNVYIWDVYKYLIAQTISKMMKEG